ncbi:uncharacterized protein [Antedon mediterranea]|uniref:uncharacterized protein isoform X2 n=1 Tax=Antedon mediterranea TaxID=105859 RepID=UPI003AF73B09
MASRELLQNLLEKKTVQEIKKRMKEKRKKRNNPLNLSKTKWHNKSSTSFLKATLRANNTELARALAKAKAEVTELHQFLLALKEERHSLICTNSEYKQRFTDIRKSLRSVTTNLLGASSIISITLDNCLPPLEYSGRSSDARISTMSNEDDVDENRISGGPSIYYQKPNRGLQTDVTNATNCSDVSEKNVVNAEETFDQNIRISLPSFLNDTIEKEEKAKTEILVEKNREKSQKGKETESTKDEKDMLKTKTKLNFSTSFTESTPTLEENSQRKRNSPDPDEESVVGSRNKTINKANSFATFLPLTTKGFTISKIKKRDSKKCSLSELEENPFRTISKIAHSPKISENQNNSCDNSSVTDSTTKETEKKITINKPETKEETIDLQGTVKVQPEKTMTNNGMERNITDTDILTNDQLQSGMFGGGLAEDINEDMEFTVALNSTIILGAMQQLAKKQLLKEKLESHECNVTNKESDTKKESDVEIAKQEVTEKDSSENRKERKVSSGASSTESEGKISVKGQMSQKTGVKRIKKTKPTRIPMKDIKNTGSVFDISLGDTFSMPSPVRQSKEATVKKIISSKLEVKKHKTNQVVRRGTFVVPKTKIPKKLSSSDSDNENINEKQEKKIVPGQPLVIADDGCYSKTVERRMEVAEKSKKSKKHENKRTTFVKQKENPSEDCNSMSSKSGTYTEENDSDTTENGKSLKNVKDMNPDIPFEQKSSEDNTQINNDKSNKYESSNTLSLTKNKKHFLPSNNSRRGTFNLENEGTSSALTEDKNNSDVELNLICECPVEKTKKSKRGTFNKEDEKDEGISSAVTEDKNHSDVEVNPISECPVKKTKKSKRGTFNKEDEKDEGTSLPVTEDKNHSNMELNPISECPVKKTKKSRRGTFNKEDEKDEGTSSPVTEDKNHSNMEVNPISECSVKKTKNSRRGTFNKEDEKDEGTSSAVTEDKNHSNVKLNPISECPVKKTKKSKRGTFNKEDEKDEGTSSAVTEDKNHSDVELNPISECPVKKTKKSKRGTFNKEDEKDEGTSSAVTEDKNHSDVELNPISECHVKKTKKSRRGTSNKEDEKDEGTSSAVTEDKNHSDVELNPISECPVKKTKKSKRGTFNKENEKDECTSSAVTEDKNHSDVEVNPISECSVKKTKKSRRGTFNKEDEKDEGTSSAVTEDKNHSDVELNPISECPVKKTKKSKRGTFNKEDEKDEGASSAVTEDKNHSKRVPKVNAILDCPVKKIIKAANISESAAQENDKQILTDEHSRSVKTTDSFKDKKISKKSKRGTLKIKPEAEKKESSVVPVTLEGEDDLIDKIMDIIDAKDSESEIDVIPESSIKTSRKKTFLAKECDDQLITNKHSSDDAIIEKKPSSKKSRRGTFKVKPEAEKEKGNTIAVRLGKEDAMEKIMDMLDSEDSEVMSDIDIPVKKTRKKFVLNSLASEEEDHEGDEVQQEEASLVFDDDEDTEDDDSEENEKDCVPVNSAENKDDVTDKIIDLKRKVTRCIVDSDTDEEDYNMQDDAVQVKKKESRASSTVKTDKKNSKRNGTKEQKKVRCIIDTDEDECEEEIVPVKKTEKESGSKMKTDKGNSKRSDKIKDSRKTEKDKEGRKTDSSVPDNEDDLHKKVAAPVNVNEKKDVKMKVKDVTKSKQGVHKESIPSIGKVKEKKKVRCIVDTDEDECEEDVVPVKKTVKESSSKMKTDKRSSKRSDENEEQTKSSNKADKKKASSKQKKKPSKSGEDGSAKASDDPAPQQQDTSLLKIESKRKSRRLTLQVRKKDADKEHEAVEEDITEETEPEKKAISEVSQSSEASTKESEVVPRQRTSRRAGVVSYKEPSLNSKLRRSDSQTSSPSKKKAKKSKKSAKGQISTKRDTLSNVTNVIDAIKED